MFWTLIILIILIVHFAFQAIFRTVLKKILSKFFPKLELTYGSSFFFSIIKLVGENDIFSIEVSNLKLYINLFAIFDLVQRSPFHLQFDKFHVNIKDDLAKIKNKKNNKVQKNISFKFWILQKVTFFLTPLFIRKFSFNLNNIQINFIKLNTIIKIKNITELFKIACNYVHNELRILSLSAKIADIPVVQIPEVRLSLTSDINILKILMITAIKRLSFAIELLTIQFSRGLISLIFNNVFLFMSSDKQVKCFIDIKPIKIIIPPISIDHQNLILYFSNINGGLSKIQCSEISAINREKTFLNVQQLRYSSKKLDVPSINVELSYPLMLTVASLLQIAYKNEPKIPKTFKIPLNVNCNCLHFKIDISDYHKIVMNFQKGFQLIGDNDTYQSNNNDNYSLHLNENNDLCALVLIPKGTCSTFDKDCNVYRPLMKVSKAQVEFVNSKYYKFFAKSYDFFVSPMFSYMPYFKIIGKCFSHLMSILKGPNFKQFEDYPPTLVHFIFNVKTFRLIFLKHELTAKIAQSIDAKMSTISELQLRLQKFFQIMKNNQFKTINDDEVDKTFKEIRYKLYREALKKIHGHDEDSNNEKFATFVMKNVILDIDGFHFTSKKEIIENLAQDEKYKSLKLTKEQIGKINSVKLVIQIETFDIFSNINSQFSQYEICKMKKIYYGIEFHFLDKRAISNHDFFLNELSLNGEKFSIPILSSEPLLIYDKLVFTFDRFSFDFIPAFTSYYQDSMIMISMIFQKLVPYPKIALFDNLRMRNVIYGFMKFNKLKLNIMPKPKSALATITFYDLAWSFVNPLNHVFSFEKFSVNLKNKELFMSYPSMIMDAKLKIINKNFEKEGEIVPTPFVEVDSVKMLDIGYDPYEMSRSHQIDFTIEMKFPKLEESNKTKTTHKNATHDGFIELNFDYLSTIIDKFLIKKKFSFEKVQYLFEKSVKKKHPIVQNYKVISTLFPSINIHFSSYTINANMSQINCEKVSEKTDFSFKSLEFWFIRMKNMHTGTLSLTDISGSLFSKKTNFPSQYQIKKFRFEIYDKFLIHFFLKLGSLMPSMLNKSATAYNDKPTHSTLSLNTKSEEEKRLKKQQKKINDEKCTRLDPETTLTELFSLFQTASFLVFLDEATIVFFHRSFTVPPSVSFNKLSVEGRKSSVLKGGRMDIIKFEEFTAAILQKAGIPFIQAKEMEFDVLLSMDRLFLTAQLKKGMNMNIQNDAISLTTNELFSNLPKIEQIFNDENFIKLMNKHEQKEEEEKRKEAEKKKKSNPLNYYDNSSEYFILKTNNNNDDELSSSSSIDLLDQGQNVIFSKQFKLLITSNIEINLIDSDFNSIATLKSNKIDYSYIFKANITETQKLVIGDLEVCNNTNSAKDKATGELTRYYKFMKVIENTNENKFLEMNVIKNLNLMKLPFFSKVSIKIRPVEVNISREFINVLAYNFKLFSKFNVFDFDKMKKYFIQMKQKSKSAPNNNEQDDDDDNEDSVAAAAAAAVSSNPDENPYGFYGTVEVADMKFRMSILNDNATIFKSFENRALNIDKIVVNDLFATKERILKLVKKKITLDILKSIPTLFLSEKDKK